MSAAPRVLRARAFVWFGDHSLYFPQSRQPRGSLHWLTYFSAERPWPDFLKSFVSRFRPGGICAAYEITSETQHGVVEKGWSWEYGVRSQRRVRATLLYCGEVRSGSRVYGAEGDSLGDADILCPFRRGSRKDSCWSPFIQQHRGSVCSLNINFTALVKRAGSSPGPLSLAVWTSASPL